MPPASVARDGADAEKGRYAVLATFKAPGRRFRLTAELRIEDAGSHLDVLGFNLPGGGELTAEHKIRIALGEVELEPITSKLHGAEYVLRETIVLDSPTADRLFGPGGPPAY